MWKINDKLSQIAKLKAQVKEGKQLEANQLKIIKEESELLDTEGTFFFKTQK